MKYLSWRTAYKFLHAKQFQTAFALLVLASGISVVAIYVGYHEYPEWSSEKFLKNAQAGINTELGKLVQNNHAITQRKAVIDSLLLGNSAKLGELSRQIRQDYGLGVSGFASPGGIMLSRVKYPDVLGDNIFLNTSFGRSLVRGHDDIASVEISSVDPRHISLVGAKFIYQKEQRIGASFIGYQADDDYSQYFAAKYLRHGAQVAFYSNDYGISGSSFQKEQEKKLFSSYFHPDSDVIKGSQDKLLFRTPSGGLYFVRNLRFPGLESSPGGMLIFIPLQGFWLAGLAAIMVPIFLFLLLLIENHHRSFPWFKKVNNFWRFPVTYVCIGVYIILSGLLYVAFFYEIPPLNPYTYPLYNSVLRFQPEGGVFDRNFARRISVLLDSGNESINAIRIAISYNPEELKIQSLDMERSICQHFIISKQNAQAGTVEMECIIPYPGFSGSSAVVADLFVKAQPNVSQGSLHWLDSSQILANDGLGTNVLRMTTDARWRFIDPDQLAAGKLIVVSPSHSNAERWYASRKVALSWSPALPGVVFADNDSGQKNIASSLPPVVKTVTSDGPHTFTVSTKNPLGGDSIGTVSVLIDSTPPDKAVLEASETRLKEGGLVRFRASGHDALSGLQRVFYLKVNDEIFFPIGSEVYIPFPTAGIYSVTLRVYDKAGNYKDTAQRIVVTN